MPRMVVTISDENGEGSVEGQRRVGRRAVTAAGSLNRGTARDSTLKILRRECRESSTTTVTANLKCNHHRQHYRMTNLRCVDIPNPDSLH